jgi:DNA topoisomerase IA
LISWVPLLKRKKDFNSVKNNHKLLINDKKNIKTISMLSGNATIFIHACDYDQGDEVISYNIWNIHIMTSIKSL